MMRNNNRPRRRELLRELSDGVLPGIPLVEISDDRRVLIEHHRGVVTYGSCEICVRVRYGIISVIGTGLNLARMTRDQLVICGCIDAVRLLRSKGGS